MLGDADARSGQKAARSKDSRAYPGLGNQLLQTIVTHNFDALHSEPRALLSGRHTSYSTLAAAISNLRHMQLPKHGFLFLQVSAFERQDLARDLTCLWTPDN